MLKNCEGSLNGVWGEYPTKNSEGFSIIGERLGSSLSPIEKLPPPWVFQGFVYYPRVLLERFLLTIWVFFLSVFVYRFKGGFFCCWNFVHYSFFRIFCLPFFILEFLEREKSPPPKKKIISKALFCFMSFSRVLGGRSSGQIRSFDFFTKEFVRKEKRKKFHLLN